MPVMTLTVKAADSITLQVRVKPTLIFDEVRSFYEGLARVARGEYPDYQYGFVDHNGQIAVPIEYDDASDFQEGLALVGKDGKWGFVDKTGKTKPITQ